PALVGRCSVVERRECAVAEDLSRQWPDLFRLEPRAEERLVTMPYLDVGVRTVAGALRRLQGPGVAGGGDDVALTHTCALRNTFGDRGQVCVARDEAVGVLDPDL